MFGRTMGKNLAALLALVMLLSGLSLVAQAAPGDAVRCKVTSQKANLYGEMNVDKPPLGEYAAGAEFTAHETQEEAWLRVDTVLNGQPIRGYVSVLDLAVTYTGEEGENEIGIGAGLGEGGDIPPDVVMTGEEGLPLEGIVQRFTAKGDRTYIFERPDVEAPRLGHYSSGVKFSGVVDDANEWIKVVATIDGREMYGYVSRVPITVTTKITTTTSTTTSVDSNRVTIRITSGVITVYAKPNKESQQLGVVSAPVRFEGAKTKSGKWVRVELDGKDTPKYGYIEAKYITKK